METTLAVALASLHPAPGGGQDAPSLRFVSPTAETYLSGPVMLKVAIDPPGAESEIENLTFFADGQQVCVVPARQPQCAWDAGPGVTEHVIRAVGRLRRGGRVIANVRTKELQHAESVTVEVVQVNVVVSEGGRFVKGLRGEQFQLLEDGRQRPITSFQPAGTALELVVAIDVSGSMTSAMPDVKTAVRKFLAALGPRDQVTLVAFNDNLFTLARRESDPAARTRAVDRLSAWGGTALYDVIVRSLEILSRQAGRRALVVFTDGEDQSSQATYEQVERLVREGDATLFVVALGRGTTIDALKERMEQLALASGGRALFVDRSDRLDRPFAEIVDELSSQYMLAFDPRHDGKWHAISVRVPNTQYRVRARQGYKAPGGTQ